MRRLILVRSCVILAFTMSPGARSLLSLAQYPTSRLRISPLALVQHEGIDSEESLVVSVVCDDVNLMQLDENEEEDPWEHVERILIPKPQSYADMIDSVMERYEYAGVRFCEADAVWKVTSESGKYTALAGKVDGKPYPTDVFLSNESSPYPFDFPLDESIRLSNGDFSLYFEVRCPREIRHGNSGIVGGTLFFVRAMEGSPIAKAFLTAQIAALRDTNPDSPLAEQIESILGAGEPQLA